MKKTLEQELKEVRALAEPGGQRALDRLLMLANASDDFHCTVLMCIELGYRFCLILALAASRSMNEKIKLLKLSSSTNDNATVGSSH